ncbi:maleylpyruvate isomerase family mycothiol-dependent enzyme [Millisia brevis]|uniref:maleylpyruvate isomerase family mycothiol-dependent enzyme n=1 Tax=Millisia brevis TaxID=264148 RepID=UPI000A7F7339
MMSDDATFAAISDERRRLATVFEEFTSDQWATPSLCAGWSVHDVAAHLVVPLVVPMWRFGVAMALARGNFDRANVAMTRHIADTRGDRLPELLTEHADKRFTPPGHGPLAPLTDVIIHGQDILRPLGLTIALDPEPLAAVLDYAARGDSTERPRFGIPLRWEATDLDWAHGSGPAVTGPAIALALILTGRMAGLADTTGDGSEHLRAARTAR